MLIIYKLSHQNIVLLIKNKIAYISYEKKMKSEKVYLKLKFY